MMERFELKVALIGYVSVGKSTVLNALLGDKFSEVSMRRTTACVNFFRIVCPESKSDDEDDGPVMVGNSTNSKVVTPNQTAEDIHEKISADNEDLRGSEKVQERSFVTVVDEPICKMRDDVDIVIVDIPGLNEAGTSVYWEYVKENWSDFDCVIVVMDALQGVNTEEQVRLLRAVDEYNKAKKSIPTIILGNKVDNPDDKEQAMLVNETRKKSAEILGDGCSKGQLEKLLKGESFPGWSTFLPCSAANAFIYRSVAHLNPEKFKMLDKSLIDKLGQEEVGRRKWKSMGGDEKAEVIFSIVKDPSGYEECLETTNFHIFLKVLDQFIGGEKRQLELIQSQIDVARQSLSFGSSTVKSIGKIYHTSTLLGLPTNGIEEEFWKVYDPKEASALTEMLSSVDPTPLGELMDELIKYHQLAVKIGWKEEQVKIEKRIKDLVLCHLRIPLQHNHINLSSSWLESGNNTSYQRNQRGYPYGHYAPGALSQTSMSPYDWHVLVSSILLPSSEKYFYKSFGPEKLRLEQLLAFYASKIASSGQRGAYETYFLSNTFGGTFDGDGVFQPDNPENHKDFCRLEMPRDLSDPKHWGHVVWLYCEFRSKLED